MSKFLLPFTLAILSAMLFVYFNTLNSDSLCVEGIYRDILNHRTLSTWTLPDTLFIFPDWPLWFLIRSFTSQLTIALFIHAVLIFFVIFLWIQKQTSKILLPFLFWVGLFPNEWWILAQPTHHGWALAIGLWWSHYYLKIENLNRRQFIQLALSASLLTANDLFFGLWFLLPLGIHSFIYRQDIKRRALLGLSIILLSILIFKIEILLIGIPKLEGIKIFYFENVGLMLKKMFIYMLDLKWVLGFFALSITLMIRHLNRQYCFYLLSFFVTLFVVLSTNLWRDHHSVRYFLPFAFFLVIPLGEIQWKKTAWGVASLLFILQLVFHFQSSQTELYAEENSVKCIEAHLERLNLSASPGLATYWAYKSNLFFSKKSLSLRQIHNNWMNYNWLTNEAWKPHAHDYSFLISRDSESMWHIKGNEIDRVMSCGKYRLQIPKTKFNIF